MELSFRTKEESNQKQREEFLALAPEERVFSFFRQMEVFSRFPKKKVQSTKNDFEIVID